MAASTVWSVVCLSVCILPTLTPIPTPISHMHTEEHRSLVRRQLHAILEAGFSPLDDFSKDVRRWALELSVGRPIVCTTSARTSRGEMDARAVCGKNTCVDDYW